MAGALAKIEAFHAAAIPPKGDDGKDALPIGNTPDGRLIYTRTIIRPAKNKAPQTDPLTGEQVWTKHPTTGEKLYARWRNVREERVQTFTLESDGRGNLYVQEYAPPSPEDLARQERERKIVEVQGQIAEALVDNDLSVDALIAALKPARKGKAD